MRVKRDLVFSLFDLLRVGLPLEQAAARLGISYSKAHGIATCETWRQEYDAEIRKLIRKIKEAYEQKSTQTEMHRDCTNPVPSGTHGSSVGLQGCGPSDRQDHPGATACQSSERGQG